MEKIGRRKKSEPNYDILFKSAVYALQRTYNDYKKAMVECLKCTWYDDNGCFCILSGAESRAEKIKVLEKKLILVSAEVEKYRILREGEQDGKK